jgi:glycosyltransferase involved in cell wall biosynthesis
MAEIGALVITRNEAANIADCLKSLQFCDERVVVDSFSDDQTVALALPLADHVYRRAFVNHAEQKNWGLARLSTRWALIVDADERVSPALAQELVALAAADAADGFWIRRRNHFFGREIKGAGWGRDRVLRFFRRGYGWYPERELHEEIEMLEGLRISQCAQRLHHHSYEGWQSSFERLLSYSQRGAAERRRRGRASNGGRIFFSPLQRFLRQYVAQGGFRDGAHGVALCGLSAVGIFLREAKLATGDHEVPQVNAGRGGDSSVEVLKGRDPKGESHDEE